MATAPVAAMARARRTLFSHFFSLNAVSPENAVAYEPARFIERRLFDRMQRLGVIIEPNPGRYYVAMPMYDSVQRSRRWGAFVVVAGAIAVGMLSAGAMMMMMHA